MNWTSTIVFISVYVSLAGCITDATVELTKAPFDATTALTNGTTNAARELIEPTLAFTSSTTPGSAKANQLALARKRMEMFTASTYENLRMDISRGRGEYLTSLSTLAGLSQDRFPLFASTMQSSYRTLFDNADSIMDATAHLVEAAWSEGYGRRETPLSSATQ